MALKKFPTFEEMIELATKFVEKQGGSWDHTAWLEFLADVQQKGVKINHETQSYMGNVIESMKKFYNSTTATKGIENVMLAMSDSTVKFIKKNQGTWDHSGWETYVKDLQQKGVELSDETKSYLGNVLESAKELYSIQGSDK